MISLPFSSSLPAQTHIPCCLSSARASGMGIFFTSVISVSFLLLPLTSTLPVSLKLQSPNTSNSSQPSFMFFFSFCLLICHCVVRSLPWRPVFFSTCRSLPAVAAPSRVARLVRSGSLHHPSPLTSLPSFSLSLPLHRNSPFQGQLWPLLSLDLLSTPIHLGLLATFSKTYHFPHLNPAWHFGFLAPL